MILGFLMIGMLCAFVMIAYCVHQRIHQDTCVERSLEAETLEMERSLEAKIEQFETLLAECDELAKRINS